MRQDEIKAGKIYTNGRKIEIQRQVKSIHADLVKFCVISSPYMSGWNAIGKEDVIELKYFAKWAKNEVWEDEKG